MFLTRGVFDEVVNVTGASAQRFGPQVGFLVTSLTCLVFLVGCREQWSAQYSDLWTDSPILIVGNTANPVTPIAPEKPRKLCSTLTFSWDN